MRKYTKDHEWALVEADIAMVGISEHAVEELGDITFIEAPEIGATLSKGDSAGFVESVKAASDIYAPLSGEVTEVNTRLENEPEIVNTEPLGEGWIYKMKLGDIGELDDLMSEEDYQKFLSTL